MITKVMIEEETLNLRALKTGSWLAVFTTLFLFGAAHSDWAWGFLIGALLSLFSVLSLTIIVPFLFRPGAPRSMQFLLGLTLFMKMPLYMVALYLVTRVQGIAPAASVFGIALLPGVIFLKTLGGVLTEAGRQPQEKAAALAASIEEAIHLGHPQRPAHPTRPVHAELARERG